MQPEYFTRAEAAVYLTSRGFPVTKATLQKWATTGGGPLYRIFGNKALYTAADLDAWAQEKLSAPRRSTSDLVAARCKTTAPALPQRPRTRKPTSPSAALHSPWLIASVILRATA